MAKTHSTERKERGTSLTIMKFGESTVFAFTFEEKKRKQQNSGYINASAKKDTQIKDKWIFIQK